jgi:hypothetical protein
VRVETVGRRRERGVVRASDGERELAVESLRRHCAAGRLTLGELEERVERAYAADTRSELAALMTDLPSDRLGRAGRRAYRWQREALKVHAETFVVLNGGLAAIWAATGEGFFWPAIVLVPTAALVAGHAGLSRVLRELSGPAR